MLFMALDPISLSDQNDSITWRWTANGCYSIASAYECQFLESMISFPAADIWTAKTEQTYKFFAWLTLHNRVLTADNLIKRSWPCNPLCPLYLCIDETTPHLLTQCNYTEVAWNLATQKFKLPSYVIMQARGGPAHWVQFFSASGGLSGRKEIKGSLIIKRPQFYSLPSCCKRPFDFKDWPGTTPNVGYVACFLSAL
jgi:hypothetical protein